MDVTVQTFYLIRVSQFHSWEQHDYKIQHLRQIIFTLAAFDGYSSIWESILHGSYAIFSYQIYILSQFDDVIVSVDSEIDLAGLFRLQLS